MSEARKKARAALAARYAAALIGYGAELRADLALLDEDPEALQRIRGLAHRLAGSGGSFGYPEITTWGRAAELAPEDDLARSAAALVFLLEAGGRLGNTDETTSS